MSEWYTIIGRTDSESEINFNGTWPFIPRIGETILYTHETDEYGDIDKSSSFEGKVIDVHWSIVNDGEFTVFILVAPNEKRGF